MEKNLLNVLLKRLPKKYHDRVDNIEEEPDLVDGCKYMLYYNENYKDFEGIAGSCFPVRNMDEARDFIKDLEHI